MWRRVWLLCLSRRWGFRNLHKGAVPFLPFLSLSPPFSLLSPSPLEVGPLNNLGDPGECYKLPSGVRGRAPAEFGAL